MVTKSEAQEIYTNLIESFRIIDGFHEERCQKELHFNNSTTSLGLCKYIHTERDCSLPRGWKPKLCKIYISENILGDRQTVINVIAHELVHTFDNCQDHKKEFKRIAWWVGHKLNIVVSTRGTKDECANSGFAEAKIKKSKYVLQCTKCGIQYGHQRKTKAVQYPFMYHCGYCGKEGRLVLL